MIIGLVSFYMSRARDTRRSGRRDGVAGWLVTAAQIRLFCVVIEALVWPRMPPDKWCLVSLTGVCCLGVSHSSPRRL